MIITTLISIFDDRIEFVTISQSMAILVLREMVESGIIVKEGGGKYQRYRMSGQ
ncbi:MAG: hypothetical protein PHZ09_03730 [Eubacteriales bacterium]|nr:hypothetical protein [Eubacteriales bacterium]